MVTGVLLIAGDGLFIAVIQFMPLILLHVRDYAVYAGLYLIYAAALALMFALLSDPWARSVRQGVNRAIEEVRSYYAVLSAMALGTGLVMATTGAVLGLGLVASTALLIAGTAALFRVGSRYFLIATTGGRVVGWADTISAGFGLIAVIVLVTRQGYSLEHAIILWMIVSLMATAATRVKPLISLKELRRWPSGRGSAMLALLSEAAIMNLASVGTPYAVGAILGAPGLAAHRGATSLAYPVRLVLGAVRSRLVTGALRPRVKVLLLVGLLGILLGSAAVVLLMGLRRSGYAVDSVLVMLGAYPYPVGLLIAATSVSTFLQFAVRGSVPGRSLLFRRGLHTSIVLLVTIVGALAGGVGSMLWGAAIAAWATVPIWASRVVEAHGLRGACDETRP